MSTKVVPLTISNLSISTTDLSAATTTTTTQKEQLLTIINNQKLRILNLEKELIDVKNERDSLLEEKKLAASIQNNNNNKQVVEPIPPPRSPYRQYSKENINHHHHQQNNSDIDEEENDSIEEKVVDMENTINNNNNNDIISKISPSIDFISMNNQQQQNHYLITPTTPTSPTSPTSPKLSSPIHAILDKDAKLFAKYQQAIKKKTSLKQMKSQQQQQQQQQEKEKEQQHENSNNNNDDGDSQLMNNNVRRALSQPNLSFSPNEVPSFSNITIKLANTRIRKNNKGNDIVSFIVSICHSSSKNELWRIEKVYSDFLALDILLRGQNSYIAKKLGKLPDKTLLAVHNQSKINQRMAIIEKYLTRAIQLPLPDTSDLSQFLSSNVIEQSTNQSTFIKEGYLSKCTKSFGGWKPFYFILNGSTLDYYESKGGLLLGSIQLSDAQVVLQQQQQNNKCENNLNSSKTFIVTQKSSSVNPIQHTLCASSDEDCFQWVQTLSKLIKPINKPSSPILLMNHHHHSINSNNTQQPRKISKDQIKPISSSHPISPTENVMIHNNNNNNNNNLITCEQISFHHSPYYFPQRSNSDTSIHPSEIITEIRGNGNYHSTSMDETYSTLHTFTKLEHLRQRSSMDTIYAHQRRESHDPSLMSSHHKNNHNNNNNITTTTTNGNNNNSKNLSSSSPSPTSFDDDTTQSKKLKIRANRRTFWPKKIFAGYNNHHHFTASHESTTNVLRGFLSRNSHDETSSSKYSSSLFTSIGSYQSLTSSSSSINSKVITPVFGVPLEEAVRLSRIYSGYELPAVVYRCIEFLENKDAIHEEGIYRLSGSAVKIKELKKAFDEKGDINLLTSDKYKDCDIHAISGLLKLWLRELPSNVLTGELLKEFLPVIDLTNRNECINELGRLISMLPLANYTLLRALTAHLLRIVQNSDVNKMTLRNIGIVFSPTLGIPTGIFSLFLCEFDYIFDTLNQSTTTTTTTTTTTNNNNNTTTETTKTEIPTTTTATPIPSTNTTAENNKNNNQSNTSSSTTLINTNQDMDSSKQCNNDNHDQNNNNNNNNINNNNNNKFITNDINYFVTSPTDFRIPENPLTTATTTKSESESSNIINENENDDDTNQIEAIHPYHQPVPRTNINLNHHHSEIRNNRNSRHYNDGAPECIVGIEKQCKDKKGIIEDDNCLEEDEEVDDFDSHDDTHSDDDDEEDDDDYMDDFDDVSVHEIPNTTEIPIEDWK